MSLKAEIADGGGTGRTAKVSSDQSLRVSNVLTSAMDLTVEEATRYKVLRLFLTDAIAGTSRDMNVDGSIVPAVFHVHGNGYAMWVTGIRFIFHSGQMALSQVKEMRRFGEAGGIDGLTNGVACRVHQGGRDTHLFDPDVVSIAGMMETSSNYLNFPDSIDQNVDYLHVDYEFDTPVVLLPGTLDAIIVTIHDDLTLLESFQVLSRGWKERIDSPS